MGIGTLITLGILIVIVVYGITIYNSLVQIKHNVTKAWANIDVLLKQRHDELPKLVETCKQYMKFEQDTLTRVIEARSKVFTAREAQNIPALGQAEGGLRSALGSLFALAEDRPIPALTGRVVDETETLTAEQKRALEVKLQEFEQSKGSQIAVLITSTTFPEPIESFSIRVAESWKIGRKSVNDGLLVVVAKSDRVMRLEVGYGLEGAIPDATARRLIDEVFIPGFGEGNSTKG